MINIRNNHINEIGALVLFATYYYVFSIDTNNESYMDSKYWLGLKKETIRTLIPIQILSTIGYKKHLCTDSATNYISDRIRCMDD